jgi:outer membrane protein with beta-barrel domain
MDQQSNILRLVCWAAVVVTLSVCASNTMAQENTPRYEVGVHISTLNVTERDDHDTGLGARFTYNLNNYLSLEAEGNRFLQTREGGSDNEDQGLFGLKAGIRKKNFGVFAKVRPGYTRFYLLGTTPGPNSFEQGHTRFALDVGGVVEYYPHRHIAVRVDAGDTMINFKNGDFFYQRLDEPMFVRSGLSHNLQINVGVAFRF